MHARPLEALPKTHRLTFMPVVYASNKRPLDTLLEDGTLESKHTSCLRTATFPLSLRNSDGVPSED